MRFEGELSIKGIYVLKMRLGLDLGFEATWEEFEAKWIDLYRLHGKNNF